MTYDLSTPGTTERLEASSVLVVAPHFDDEVLGCGGAIKQLADAGATVHVVFVTDGRGGVESIDDRDAYAARRRAEAPVAVEALGVTSFGEGGLPDGRLGDEMPAIGELVRAAWLERRPDLVFVPSPLEVTPDHRAVFRAVFDLLAPLRPGDELFEPASGARVALYEVNHPAYPDRLVDVTAEVGAIERAMEAYASQQERHDYLGAALGLRAYRALSLAPEVEAAEGFRLLELGDFTTRSWSRLVRDLGGVPELAVVSDGPLVSVVVRTHDRPELLAEALASLGRSTYRRVEIVLVNDGGRSPAAPDDLPVDLVRVELENRSGRAAAANAGIDAATGDYVAFLDDDDLVEAEHLATLVGLVSAADVRVGYTDAAVGVYELDGERGWREIERRLPYSRDFDPDLLLVDNYIPFNTVLVERSLFEEAGRFDESLEFFEDWDMMIRLAALTAFHHLPRVTCEYRHFRGGSHILGERPRRRDDFVATKERVIAKHRARLSDGALARVVDDLRAEAVEAGEAARHATSRLAEIESSFHEQRGALAAASAERDRLLAEVESLSSELRRLYDLERELRAATEEQTEHLERTYAEIERLGEVIESMQATRAWRMHEWVEKRRR